MTRHLLRNTDATYAKSLSLGACAWAEMRHGGQAFVDSDGRVGDNSGRSSAQQVQPQPGDGNWHMVTVTSQPDARRGYRWCHALRLNGFIHDSILHTQPHAQTTHVQIMTRWLGDTSCMSRYMAFPVQGYVLMRLYRLVPERQVVPGRGASVVGQAGTR